MSIETREDAEKKPELTEVIQLANDAFTTHGTRINEMNRMSDIVNRRYQPFADPPDPKRFKPVIPGTGGAKVHRIASQVVSDRPIVRYPPRNNTNQAQEVAALRGRSSISTDGKPLQLRAARLGRSTSANVMSTKSDKLNALLSK